MNELSTTSSICTGCAGFVDSFPGAVRHLLSQRTGSPYPGFAAKPGRPVFTVSRTVGSACTHTRRKGLDNV